MYYKLVNPDGETLKTSDGTTEIHSKNKNDLWGMIPENQKDKKWFIVPADYTYVQTLNGKSWTTPGQRG